MEIANSNSPIFLGWYIVATCFFIAFLIVGVRIAFGIFVIPFDLTGSYTLPFAIAGSLLFPAGLTAFAIKEKQYSIRYRTSTKGIVT